MKREEQGRGVRLGNAGLGRAVHGGVFLEVDRGDCWACDRHWNLGKLNVNSIWAMWGGRGGVTANKARRR